jgi:hypothetical protein
MTNITLNRGKIHGFYTVFTVSCNKILKLHSVQAKNEQERCGLGNFLLRHSTNKEEVQERVTE